MEGKLTYFIEAVLTHQHYVVMNVCLLTVVKAWWDKQESNNQMEETSPSEGCLINVC